jgi:hypothetical protein
MFSTIPVTLEIFMKEVGLATDLLVYKDEVPKTYDLFNGLVLWPSQILGYQANMRPLWGFDAAVETEGNVIQRIYVNPQAEHSTAEIAEWLWCRFTEAGKRHAQTEMVKMWEDICSYTQRDKWFQIWSGPDARIYPQALLGRAAFWDYHPEPHAASTYYVHEDRQGNLRINHGDDLERVYESGVLASWLKALQAEDDWRVRIFAEARTEFRELEQAILALPEKWRSHAVHFQYQGSLYQIELPHRGSKGDIVPTRMHKPNLTEIHVLYHRGLFRHWKEAITPQSIAAWEAQINKFEAEQRLRDERRADMIDHIEVHKTSRRFVYNGTLYVLAGKLYCYKQNSDNQWVSSTIDSDSDEDERILEVWAKSLGWEE